MEFCVRVSGCGAGPVMLGVAGGCGAGTIIWGVFCTDVLVCSGNIG